MSTTVRAQFDTSGYWHDRLGEIHDLRSTGTRPFDATYQRYLYRLKEAALRRALRPWRERLERASVLNAGCGWGYFEPFFTRLGAAQVTGIDFVESAIDRLREQQPEFEYLVADVGGDLPEALSDRRFDVVTAIDVLYHVVDDGAFRRALVNLCGLCRGEGGLLVWTDRIYAGSGLPDAHCCFRGWEAYGRLLNEAGFRLRRAVPMYCLFDQYWSWCERVAQRPRVSFPLLYAFDRAFARFGWRRSTNYVMVAERVERG